MSRMPILFRIAPLSFLRCLRKEPWDIRPDFSGLSPWKGKVAYALLTRAPVAGRAEQAQLPVAPRLACVRPVASVHPEPGSNSPLLDILFFLFLSFGQSSDPGRLTTLFSWVECDRRFALLYFFLVFRNLVNVLRFVLPPWPLSVALLSQSECKVMPFILSLQICSGLFLWPKMASLSQFYVLQHVINGFYLKILTFVNFKNLSLKKIREYCTGFRTFVKSLNPRTNLHF